MEIKNKRTKTCMQKVLSRRTGRVIERRLPHVVPDGTVDGYAYCSECGTEVYVGTPPVNRKIAEFVCGPDAETVTRSLGYRW